jgi:DNA polymerase-1
MEKTGGEPDVVGVDKKTGEYIFYDCSIESPSGRRSLCYDRQAHESRKENKPKNNAIDMANEMGIELLTEEQYRELQKLLSTYIDVIPKMVGEDGRLHAKFLQNGSSTGRFSSQDPNLQNLPIKTELGKRIRNGFIATNGYKLCAFDYSQIELRVAAILSGDKKMTQIFKEGKDIHAGVASFVFGVPIEKVDSEMRRVAKIINFGILYGMGG